MSQSLAEAHIGVMKRKFALWVRARIAAGRKGEDNEDSNAANAIKQSWPDVIDSIVAAMNDTWSRAHPRPLPPLQVLREVPHGQCDRSRSGCERHEEDPRQGLRGPSSPHTGTEALAPVAALPANTHTHQSAAFVPTTHAAAVANDTAVAPAAHSVQPVPG